MSKLRRGDLVGGLTASPRKIVLRLKAANNHHRKAGLPNGALPEARP